MKGRWVLALTPILATVLLLGASVVPAAAQDKPDYEGPNRRG
jgi:hypothetical protein